MGERYTQLVKYDSLCSPEGGAPVIVAAAALLKDTFNDTVIAQLKFKSISDAIIKAINVSVTPFSTEGERLDDVVEHLYLDLKEERDAVFGQKEAIHLPDKTTRQIEIKVTRVVFEDNSSWVTDAVDPWEPLVKPGLLSEALKEDGELVKQYSLEYGSDSVVFPLKTNDVWFCKCGAINRLEEELCHSCKIEQSRLFKFDINDLEQKKEERLKAEEEQRQKEAERKKEEAAQKIKDIKKLAKRIGLIVAALVIIGLLASLTTKVIIPHIKYSNAKSLMKEGKYTEAEDKFNELRGYKDSSTMANKAVNAQHYKDAKKAFDDGKYSEAEKLFKKAVPYKDSSKMAKRSKIEQAFVDAEQELSASKYANAVEHVKSICLQKEATKNDIKRADECLNKILQGALNANETDVAKEAANLIQDQSIIETDTTEALEKAVKKQEAEKKQAEIAAAYKRLNELGEKYISFEDKKEVEELMKIIPSNYKNMKEIKKVYDFYKPYLGEYYGDVLGYLEKFYIYKDKKKWKGRFHFVSFDYPNKKGNDKDNPNDEYYDEATLVNTKKIIERDVFKGVEDDYENYVRVKVNE